MVLYRSGLGCTLHAIFHPSWYHPAQHLIKTRMTTLSQPMQPSFAMLLLQPQLLCSDHSKRGTQQGEVCPCLSSWPHIGLSRIDRSHRVGEQRSQIFASRFLFWFWTINLTDDSDINIITMMAFISLTGVINQNLDSLFFYLSDWSYSTTQASRAFILYKKPYISI